MSELKLFKVEFSGTVIVLAYGLEEARDICLDNIDYNTPGGITTISTPCSKIEDVPDGWINSTPYVGMRAKPVWLTCAECLESIDLNNPDTAEARAISHKKLYTEELDREISSLLEKTYGKD